MIQWIIKSHNRYFLNLSLTSPTALWNCVEVQYELLLHAFKLNFGTFTKPRNSFFKNYNNTCKPKTIVFL